MRVLIRSLSGFLISVVLGLGIFAFRTRQESLSQELTTTASSARAAVIGRVIRVSDGDTIAVQVRPNEKPLKVRFLGIDAPEKKQPFGEYCRRKLADFIADKEVEILLFDQDRYGRTLGKVLEAKKGEHRLDYGLEMISLGCAWHYKHFARNQPASDRVTYARAEISARQELRGLWKEWSTAQAPWDYRKQIKTRRLASQVSPRQAMPVEFHDPAGEEGLTEP